MKLQSQISYAESHHASFAGVPGVGRDRPKIFSQRGTCRVTLTPKYGDGPRLVNVSYSWIGAIGAPTVIVQGGISADRDVTVLDEHATPGWWQALVGVDAAIDVTRWRVLAIDWLDAAQIGEHAVSSTDQADAVAALLQTLGVARAHAFVGSSYGAMVALAFGARHPRLVGKLVLLAGAHRAHPLSTAQRSVQRGIVRLGQASGQGREALALARQLAITTYRGSTEFGQRFAGVAEFRDERFHFPVEDYLEHQGLRFVERFDADRFLALSESIDLHQVDPTLVTVPTTVIAVEGDRLVPLSDAVTLVEGLGLNGSLRVLRSRYGHDAFLKEGDRIDALLGAALRQNPTGETA